VDQDGRAREAEASGGVVDDVDLAGVLAGLEIGERHVELEGDSVARRFVDLRGADERRLKSLGAVVEELDARQHVSLRLLVRRVDLIEEI